jgi:type II secretory pathway pseudopilin PulG
VSISVIAVLVSILLPSLSMVRETTRRVICSSNIRQIGLALAMYADDYRGQLPETKFISPKGSDLASVPAPQLQNVLMARLGAVAGDWDGLGHLFELDYLDQYGVFYCPSHHGDDPISAYKEIWVRDWGQLVLNYQYRAPGSLSTLNPGAALVSDGLRTAKDYSHKVGANVLRSDFSTSWYSDPTGSLVAGLPQNSTDSEASNKVENAWQLLDDRR